MVGAGPRVVGVEGIDRVVLGGDNHDVVWPGTGAGHAQAADVERLGIDLAVYRVAGDLAEGRGVHVGGCQGRLIEVGAGAELVVVVGEDSLQGPAEPPVGRARVSGAGAEIESLVEVLAGPGIVLVRLAAVESLATPEPEPLVIVPGQHPRLEGRQTLLTQLGPLLHQGLELFVTAQER